MKDICLQGYNSRYITMLCDGEAAPCDLVVMSANNTVKKATSGKFMGVSKAQQLVMSTFKRLTQRPSAVKAWQQPGA